MSGLQKVRQVLQRAMVFGSFFFFLNVFELKREVTVNPENDLLVEGKQVDYIFFPGDPQIVSHAEYLFRNQTPSKKICSITACSFIENEHEAPLSNFRAYAGDVLLEGPIEVAPSSELAIRVTFPFRRVQIRFRYAVRLRVDCEGRLYDVTSKLSVTQEKPL